MEGRAMVAAVIVSLLTISITPSQLSELPNDSESVSNDSTLDLLFIGNSYTANNQLNVRVENLLNAAGFNPDTQSLTSGGKTLSWHGEQAEAEGSDWYRALRTPHDFVILQDQSQIPGFPTGSASWQDSMEGAQIIDQLVDQNGGDLFFLMTWGYRNGDQNNNWRYPDYQTMQQHLKSGYIAYAENLSSDERPVFIAPVGMAYENIFFSIPNASEDGTIFSDLYAPDGSHPSIQGTYLAACVIHSSVTGESSIGLPSTGGINGSRTFELQQWADHTVFNTSGFTYPWQLDDLGVEFGTNSGSIFNIEPGLTIGISANFTNLAEVNTTALIQINGPDGWIVSWDYPTSPIAGFSFDAPSDLVQWVEFRVTAPEVSSGYPLADSIHDFSLALEGDRTGNLDWWNFSLRYGEWKGVSLVQGGGVASIEPGGIVDLEFDIQNIGNSINSMEFNIAAKYENGSLVNTPSLSFSHEGWTAIVYDRAGLEDMNPGEITTVRMQVKAPSSTSGKLEMYVQIAGNGIELQETNQSVSIVPRSGGELGLTNIDCIFQINPGESCSVELFIENTGDATYDFNLTITKKPHWLEVEISQFNGNLGPGQTIHGIEVTASTRQGLNAGISGEVTIELGVDGWVPAEVSFVVEIASDYGWEIIRSDAEVMNGRLTGYWEVKNIGNSPDGLVIAVECSDFTNFGITHLPENGEAENHGRSFEKLNIPRNGTVLFEVWMDIPDEAPIAAEAVLTVEVRSFRDPSISYIQEHSTEIGGAQPTQPTGSEETSVFSEFLQRWLQTILIIIVSIIGSISVAYAIRYRIEADREYYRKNNTKVTIEEEAESWMNKFEKIEKSEPPNIKSPTKNVAEFRREFLEKSGDHSRAISSGPESEVIDQAVEILDESQAEDAFADAIELADNLQNSDLIHPDNMVLDLDDFDEKLDSLRRGLGDDEDL